MRRQRQGEEEEEEAEEEEKEEREEEEAELEEPWQFPAHSPMMGALFFKERLYLFIENREK